MKRESYYFSHDFNARNDPKLQRLLMKHGLAGIGLYWCLIEMIYEQGGEIERDTGSIAFSLHCDEKLIDSVIDDFELFGQEEQYVFSRSVNRRNRKSEEMSKKRSEAGKIGNSVRWHRKRIANASQTHRNAIQEESQCIAIIRNNIIEKEKNDNIATNVASSETSSDTEAGCHIDLKKFMEFFNSEMDKANALIPRVRSIDGQRKKFLEARIREYGKEAVADAVRKAANSNFLNGGGNTGFKADFGWIFRPNNFPKVLEGNYDNDNRHHENDKQGLQDRRRGTDVTATSAEDYKGRF